MEFVELKEKEFDEYSEKHEYGSFYQSSNWGKLKEANGWKYYLVGIKESKKILGATLLLEKSLPLGLKIFYSPRGFLIDYKNKKVLTEFVNNVKAFIKKRHGIFLKIDPYVNLYERDINGDIVNEENNNLDAVDNLKALGFKHYGFSLDMETLQPRFAFSLNLEGETIESLHKNFKPNVRNYLNKADRIGVKVRFIDVDEMDKFKKVMQHTANRRGFIDRPLEYYKNMMHYLKDKIKVVVTEINLKDYSNKINDEIIKLEDVIKTKEEDLKDETKRVNEKKLKQEREELSRLEKKKKEIDKLYSENGEVLLLGGMMFMIHGGEILSLFGGSFEEFNEFLSPYPTYYSMIEYGVKNGFKKYNFYGISGDFKNKDNPLYGLYDFKRSFGGYVEEYIGEFDLILSKPKYHLYNFALKVYKKLKKLKNRNN